MNDIWLKAVVTVNDASVYRYFRTSMACTCRPVALFTLRKRPPLDISGEYFITTQTEQVETGIWIAKSQSIDSSGFFLSFNTPFSSHSSTNE